MTKCKFGFHDWVQAVHPTGIRLSGQRVCNKCGVRSFGYTSKVSPMEFLPYMDLVESIKLGKINRSQVPPSMLGRWVIKIGETK